MADLLARTARPSEVARFLGVDVKTVARYARAGRIPCNTTPSGHRRFNLVEVRLALSLPEPRRVSQDESGAAVAVELERIGADLAALGARLQAVARTARRSRSGG